MEIGSKCTEQEEGYVFVLKARAASEDKYLYQDYAQPARICIGRKDMYREQGYV